MDREEAIKIVQSATVWTDEERDALAMLIPELAESDDERIRKEMISMIEECTNWVHKKEYIAYLEKLKENPKSADSIPSDYTSDVKCEDRWHKVTDFLPDNGRLVLAKDCLGNVLLARYDGENWEVNVYDNEDHYCHNSISKWCEIPSEKQKEQKPAEWSDTNELVFKDICKHLKEEGYNGWIVLLEALRNGEFQPKQEWSEEDECTIADLINYFEGDALECSIEEMVQRIKSLRPSWKPSEEQMKQLHYALTPGSAFDCDILNELYRQLRKLM